jgi:hypothetical protein
MQRFTQANTLRIVPARLATSIFVNSDAAHHALKAVKAARAVGVRAIRPLCWFCRLLLSPHGRERRMARTLAPLHYALVVFPP